MRNNLSPGALLYGPVSLHQDILFFFRRARSYDCSSQRQTFDMASSDRHLKNYGYTNRTVKTNLSSATC